MAQKGSGVGPGRVNVEELKKRLPSAKQIATDLYGVEWHGNNARCPRPANHAHGDRSPSFVYLEKENRLHCYGPECFGNRPVDAIDFVRQMEGCDFQQAVDLLAKKYSVTPPAVASKRRGQSSDKRDRTRRAQLLRDGWREVATYTMGDGIRKVRFEHADRLQPEKNRPDKTFLWEHRGADGTWEPGRGDRPHRAYVNQPFRELDQVECVLGVESERSADAVGEFGIPAFSFKELTTDNAPAFDGLDLRLLPDKDEPGRQLLEKVINLLQPHARSISVVEPPADWPEAGDIHDAISERGWKHNEIEELMATAQRRERADGDGTGPAASTEGTDGHRFEDLDSGRYRLHVAGFDIVIEVDRLRRERHELFGELSVYNGPDPIALGSAVSVADFNLSSARARHERATLLEERSGTETLNWHAVIEEFCQRVIADDRKGEEAVDLRLLARPTQEDRLEVDGLTLLRKHPSIVFGDGGAAKSYLCLYICGKLAELGLRVALFDWELAGEDHRDRLERLFGPAMPKIMYARCERPLVYEVDRLRRIVLAEKIDYAVYDSIVFACDGPPEAAEVASRYFGAVRRVGVGSMHVAHINKQENADKKPFGSTFWHNGARSTFFVKPSEQGDDTSILTIGLFNRKANLGPLQAPFGYKIHFGGTRTTFIRTDLTECPDMAVSLTVRQKMLGALRRGALSAAALAEEIDAKIETVTRTARRNKDQFVMLDDGKIALRATKVAE